MRRGPLARVLEVLGGALLLGSFIVQNYRYDVWNERSAELETAILEQAVIGKSVQLNELLYFAAHQDLGATEEFRAQLGSAKIQEAARKLYMSQLIPIFVSNLSAQKKEEARLRLLAGMEFVTNYQSFLKYLESVDSVSSTINPPAVLFHEANAQREAARNWFLRLYIGGAVLLLLGMAIKP